MQDGNIYLTEYHDEQRQKRWKKARLPNSTYPKGGFSCSNVGLVVNQKVVFQIKFCGKTPALL